MKKANFTLLGFNLMEMVVTMTIVAILASAGMAKLSRLKSPREIVDETTGIITSTINKAIFDSLNNTTINLCSRRVGTSASRSECVTNNTTWNNINNIMFDNKVLVEFKTSITSTETSEKNISQITYERGLISKIITLNSTPTSTTATTVTETSIDASNEGKINPIKISIKFPDHSNSTTPKDCDNTINLYPNNVIIIQKNCTKI